MKRSIVVAIASLAIVTLSGSSIHALPGPEGPRTRSRDRTFHLVIQETSGARAGAEIFATLRIPERPSGQDGWDWGGRSGYSCGFFELVDGGVTNSLLDDVVIAKVIVEKYDMGGESDGNDLYAYINSRFVGGGREPCSVIGTVPGRGAIPATPMERSRSTVPGIGAIDAMGHVVQVFQDGALVASLELPHHESHPDAWWFRGDEAGELCLWYEEDSTDEYGIVARLSVVPTVAGVTVSDYVVEHSDM